MDVHFILFSEKFRYCCIKEGDRLWVHTRITPPVNNGNPDEFDYVRYLTRKVGTGTAYISAGHWRIIGHDTSRSLRQIALDYREKVVELYHRLGFQEIILQYFRLLRWEIRRI